ncbi:hypothetical protein [Deinococcus petrolearius]|uniref:A-factor biosynthesis hotdog domain-containing protein n=1 Tax=Deinococcus petrolearius TaxID=1751295 RepID=A0ABW1DIJ9_9DEIO
MLDASRATALTTFDQVEVADLLQRICVRPPYFALEGLRWQAGEFMATAVADRSPTAEAGPMQASEISRHAAICGLSAVALGFDDDDRRYYLAQDATYTGHVNGAPYGSVVTFAAVVVERNKRQAVAAITATAGGQALAHLQVTYTILSEASFTRLFRAKYVPADGGGTPGVMPEPPMGEIVMRGHTASMTLECVPRDVCAGHFEHFPAMPVAILMGQLGMVAATQFPGPYRVAAAVMSARDFCWAGERACFEVTPQGDGVFACAATASASVVSEMTLSLVSAGVPQEQASEA